MKVWVVYKDGEIEVFKKEADARKSFESFVQVTFKVYGLGKKAQQEWIRSDRLFMSKNLVRLTPEEGSGNDLVIEIEEKEVR
jgi:hypothetical protein